MFNILFVTSMLIVNFAYSMQDKTNGPMDLPTVTTINKKRDLICHPTPEWINCALTNNKLEADYSTHATECTNTLSFAPNFVNSWGPIGCNSGLRFLNTPSMRKTKWYVVTEGLNAKKLKALCNQGGLLQDLSTWPCDIHLVVGVRFAHYSDANSKSKRIVTSEENLKIGEALYKVLKERNLLKWFNQKPVTIVTDTHDKTNIFCLQYSLKDEYKQKPFWPRITLLAKYSMPAVLLALCIYMQFTIPLYALYAAGVLACGSFAYGIYDCTKLEPGTCEFYRKTVQESTDDGDQSNIPSGAACGYGLGCDEEDGSPA